MVSGARDSTNEGIGPNGAAVSPRRTILLATELSAASVAATEEAFDLAARSHAELLIVSVIDPSALQLPGGRFRARIDQVRERRESAVQDLVRRGRSRDLRVAFLIWEGDPAESILEAAAAERVDVIVLGSHGRGPLGRLILGSVSEDVVRRARVPVIVVPRGRHRSAATGDVGVD